jgi:hypothetical protein
MAEKAVWGKTLAVIIAIGVLIPFVMLLGLESVGAPDASPATSSATDFFNALLFGQYALIFWAVIGALVILLVWVAVFSGKHHGGSHHHHHKKGRK